MVSDLCLKFKCKDCPEQTKCFGCEHNYILIKSESMSNVYKCSHCGNKLRLNKNNSCCECIHKCKGKVKEVIDKENNIYKICNNFNKGGKEDEN